MAPLPHPAQRAHHASESGLTLLELIICVAVLAVLGVLALPGLGSQFERQRLRHDFIQSPGAETAADDQQAHGISTVFLIRRCHADVTGVWHVRHVSERLLLQGRP